jgi:hypothetical protein
MEQLLYDLNGLPMFNGKSINDPVKILDGGRNICIQLMGSI